MYMKRFLYIFLFSIFLLPLQVLSEPANHIVINEVQVTGENTVKDEFVELYNPTSDDIDLVGWRLTRKTSGGTQTNLVSKINGVIPANSFFLITPQTGYEGEGIADCTYSQTSSFIAPDNTVILYSDAGYTVADKVGFGKAKDFENAAFGSNPPAGESIIRKINGVDTDNNGDDFKLSTQEAEEEQDVPAGGNAIIGIYINEVMPDPGSPKSDITDEWIELYNSNDYRADLSGSVLRDSVGVVHEYVIPDGIFIEPKGYIVFYSSATKITLNNGGDTVELLDRSKNVADQTPDYEKAAAGQSFAFFSEGWQWTKHPTPISLNIFEQDMEEAKEAKTSEKGISKNKKSNANPAKNTGKKNGSVKGATTKKGKNNSSKDDDSNKFAGTSEKTLSNKTLGIGLLALSFIAGATYIVQREKIYEIYKQKN